MPVTYEPLATTSLTGSASTITFSSISQDYTDLVLVVSAISTGTAQPDVYMRVNSDTGNNYTRVRYGGNGTASFTTRITGEQCWVIGPMENTTQTNMICQIMNYSNTLIYKTMLVRSNDPVIAVQAMTCLWNNSNAINSIVLFPEPSKGDFATGTKVTLYGIKAA